LPGSLRFAFGIASWSAPYIFCTALVSENTVCKVAPLVYLVRIYLVVIGALNVAGMLATTATVAAALQVVPSVDFSILKVPAWSANTLATKTWYVGVTVRSLVVPLYTPAAASTVLVSV
jgi:hypothetical protein